MGKRRKNKDQDVEKDFDPVNEANMCMTNERSVPEANLGCASTEELFHELITRMIMPPYHNGSVIDAERGCQLAEMLGCLYSVERAYRTYWDGRL